MLFWLIIELVIDILYLKMLPVIKPDNLLFPKQTPNFPISHLLLLILFSA